MSTEMSKPSPYLFLIKFVFIFIVLYIFFPFYRGVIGPGGKIYSSFLANHFNLIVGFTKALIGSAKFILHTAGFELYQKNYHSLQIGYSKGISVNPSCLGWAVMSFWTAFVGANTGSFNHKMKWMLWGLSTIISINIFRISLITIANHLRWSSFTSLNHHDTFNAASYVCIIILTGYYIRVQKKYERIEFESREAAYTTR